MRKKKSGLDGRIKITKNGKLIRRAAGKRHGMVKRGPKVVRQKRRNLIVPSGVVKYLKKFAL